MPQPEHDSKLIVKFDVLGAGTDKLTEWSINSAYLTSTDGFSFTAFDQKLEEDFGDLELAPITLEVDGDSQGKFRIDITTIGDRGSAVTCEGRDYIADMVECNVDPALKISAGMSLFEACTLVASPVGIDTVRSVDDIALTNIRTGVRVRKSKAASALNALKAEDLKPENGQGIYEFLNKFIARQGATIQPADDRKTLILSIPNYNQDPIGEIIRTDDAIASGRNNVVMGVARRDFSRFPTFAVFNGRHAQSGGSSKGASQQIDVSEAAFGFNPEIGRIVTDKIIPGRRKPGNSASLGNGELYRLLSHKDDDARNQVQVEKAALRAVSERLKDLLVYQCTLRGHRDPKTGAIWSIDTMVQVEDRIARVSEPMWIAERTLRFSSQEGAMTDLVCWRKGAFVL